MTGLQTWYIVKQSAGNCEVIPSNQKPEENNPNVEESWGPFNSQDEAFARRIGLIRAGKCQPV